MFTVQVVISGSWNFPAQGKQVQVQQPAAGCSQDLSDGDLRSLEQEVLNEADARTALVLDGAGDYAATADKVWADVILSRPYWL